jgi:hypothetical protein
MLKGCFLSQECAFLFLSLSCMNTKLKEEISRVGEVFLVASILHCTAGRGLYRLHQGKWPLEENLPQLPFSNS